MRRARWWIGGLVALELLCRGFPIGSRTSAAAAVAAYRLDSSLLQTDPDLGWTLAPRRDAVDGAEPIRTDDRGWRRPLKEALVERPEALVERPEALVERPAQVLCIGDEGAFGRGVAEQERWPALLQERSGKTVLAGAVPGYSSTQGRRLLERFLGEVSPEHVVIALGANDARADPVPDRIRLSSPPSAWWQPALIGRLRDWFVVAPKLGAERRLAALRQRLATTFPPGDERVATELRTVVGEIDEILASSPARVAVAEYAANLRSMAEQAQAAGATVVFLGPVFRGGSARPALDTYLAAPIGDYRQAMQAVAREVGARFVSVTLLTERARSSQRQLFLVRPLSDADRAGYRIWASTSAGWARSV